MPDWICTIPPRSGYFCLAEPRLCACLCLSCRKGWGHVHFYWVASMSQAFLQILGKQANRQKYVCSQNHMVQTNAGRQELHPDLPTDGRCPCSRLIGFCFPGTLAESWISSTCTGCRQRELWLNALHYSPGWCLIFLFFSWMSISSSVLFSENFLCLIPHFIFYSRYFSLKKYFVGL